MLLKVHGMLEDDEKLKLVGLYLRGCQLGDDEAVIIAAFLKDDDIVEKGYLNYNNLGPRGAKEIDDALKRNKTVWYLNLGGNQIGNQGAASLISALNHIICITELYINYNDIAPESMATIQYLAETRNAILIPAAVRQACLYLISARRSIENAGDLSIFPKEIVRMIAMAVWATRKGPQMDCGRI